MANTIQTSLQDLYVLLDLIKTSIGDIEQVYNTSGQPFPSLDEPFTPQSEALRMSPPVQKASSTIVAAAAQLIACVRPPPASVLYNALQVSS